MAARKKGVPAPATAEHAGAVAVDGAVSTPPPEELRLTDPLPRGRLVVEASAGTGKTYSLTALVVRHLAEGPLTPADLLVVTYTRAAAAELRDRMRRGLIEARDALDAAGEHGDDDWLSTIVTDDADLRSERRARLDEAVAGFDEATISTIHGFCQQALSQLGLRSGSLLDSELVGSAAEIVDEVCRDLVVRALWQSPLALSWTDSGKPVDPAAVFKHLVRLVASRLGNPLIAVVPSPADLADMGSGDVTARLAAWVALVDEAVDEVQRRRRARRQLGYDDLVATLHRALTEGPQAAAVGAALRERYRLVLVDEFQDTDPLQWAIFDVAFTGDLVTVGDPKQAIYRFRGADVHAYLAATATGTKRSLRTNYRSDRDLIRATNVLVEGVELGDRAIVADAVKAAGHAPARALSGGAPLVIRHLRFDERLAPAKRTGDQLSAPLARRAILADLVSTVVEMLDRQVLHEGEPDEKALSPGDIAVLVPSHSNADEVVRALAAARIPAVRARTGSVFDTAAADEWRLLLAALERPSHAPSVRAAALGAFLHCEPASIDPLAVAAAGGIAPAAGLDADTDAVTARLQQQCAAWAQRMMGLPFLAWYDEVRAASGVVEHLMAQGEGERLLTDLDHIAELLATDAAGGRFDASTARRRLDVLVADAAAMGDDEQQMRRIDSDAEAVQVSTIHGSKGLEYPVVLLPFSWTATPARGARVYNDENGRRILDVGSPFGWKGARLETTEKVRTYFDELGRQGDQLRLMYVALTRAKRRTVLWVAQSSLSSKSALNLILFDRDSEGAPLRTQPAYGRGPRGGVNTSVPKVSVTDAEAAQHLQVLQQRSDGAISVEPCPPDSEPVEWSGGGASAVQPELAIADAGGREPRRPWWGRWSFSAVHATADYADRSAAAAADVAVAGGADEPVVERAGADEVAVPAVPGRSVDVPLAAMVAGTEFGTLVHEVLERVDPMTDPLEPHVRAEVDRALGRDRMALDRRLLVEGLAAAIRTPLGDIAGGRSLADIPVGDRLAELDFELPLRGGAGQVAIRQVGEVLQSTLPADDAQRAYADTLAAGRFDLDIGGFLRGSIDAVLRVEVGGVMRHLVVDYKTNRLHRRDAADPLAAYHPSLLPASMAASDYVLQGLLYSVAVHRFLRSRMAGYDPAAHLGGIAYLYVRGMVGPATPVVDGHAYGVFAWRPPVEAITALDDLFATGALR